MNIKVENSQNICRTCLQDHTPGKAVYDLEFYSPINNISVVDFIYNLTHIKFEKGDGFPEHLCTICIKKVNEAYEFSLLCHNSHIKLQQSLKESSENKGLLSEQIESSNVVFSENDNENSLLEHPTEIIDFKSINYDNYEIIHENSTDDGCTNNKSNFDNIKHEILETEDLNKYAKPKIYKCEWCDKSFVRKVYLTTHLKSHSKSNEKQYICEECGKSYSYLYLLRQHRFKHSEVKPFPCLKCNKGCMTRESLRRHMKIHDMNYKRKKTHKKSHG
ncbi:zinc finger protein 85-like isoform X2 [Agrilus planipennis]|uniref:Zinc finger protein 85-like isoform X2 n=1 Tax=Agrilus planipennis TaxID=224129 RepID=A0A1W4WJ96_AGRPL|nr:zinc finger protein 85-like isoform X2 [Agrilus planipennis]